MGDLSPMNKSFNDEMSQCPSIASQIFNFQNAPKIEKSSLPDRDRQVKRKLKVKRKKVFKHLLTGENGE